MFSWVRLGGVCLVVGCSDPAVVGSPDASTDATTPDARVPQCSVASDCVGFGDPCYVSVACESGRCAIALEPYGKELGPEVQTSSDCLRVACDGFGKRTKLPDSSDPEDDGDSCTRDFCIEGTPHAIHPPLPNGTACDGGPECVNGSCVTDAGAPDAPDAADASDAADG